MNVDKDFTIEHCIKAEKNIITSPKLVFIGKSGVGKSSLLNLLYQDSYLFKDTMKPAPIGKKSSSETKKITFYHKDTTDMIFVDTMGLADPFDVSESSLKMVRNFLLSIKGRNAKIILVMSVGRLTPEEQSVIIALDELLSRKQNWMENAILFFSSAKTTFKFEEWLDIESKEENVNYRKVINILRKFTRVLQFDNNDEPDYRMIVEPKRAEFKKLMNEVITEINPTSALGLTINDAMRFVKHMMLNMKYDDPALVQILGDFDQTEYFGDCQICANSIYDDGLVTKCNGVLICITCSVKWKHECPFCRFSPK